MSTGREPHRPGPVEWVTLGLVCASSMLSALLELLFVARFYVGTVIVPLVVIAAVVGNAGLSWWGFRLAGSTRGAVLPLVSWLLVVLGLTLYNRPEGDLFVINEYGEQGAFYALVLIGAGAGFATVMILSGRAVRRPAAPPAPPTRPSARPVPRPNKNAANRPTKRPPVGR